MYKRVQDARSKILNIRTTTLGGPEGFDKDFGKGAPRHYGDHWQHQKDLQWTQASAGVETFIALDIQRECKSAELGSSDSSGPVYLPVWGFKKLRLKDVRWDFKTDKNCVRVRLTRDSVCKDGLKTFEMRRICRIYAVQWEFAKRFAKRMNFWRGSFHEVLEGVKKRSAVCCWYCRQ